MVLLKKEVKLLGEIVGRTGRKPDPAKVQAIHDWAELRNLKDLQEFLGTTNYSRPFMGPSYAKAMEGLRRYLKEGDSGFPLTPRGKDSVERLKNLVQEHNAIAVPDERAAAGGWRPYTSSSKTMCLNYKSYTGSMTFPSNF